MNQFQCAKQLPVTRVDFQVPLSGEGGIGRGGRGRRWHGLGIFVVFEMTPINKEMPDFGAFVLERASQHRDVGQFANLQATQAIRHPQEGGRFASQCGQCPLRRQTFRNRLPQTAEQMPGLGEPVGSNREFQPRLMNHFQVGHLVIPAIKLPLLHPARGLGLGVEAFVVCRGFDARLISPVHEGDDSAGFRLQAIQGAPRFAGPYEDGGQLMLCGEVQCAMDLIA